MLPLLLVTVPLVAALILLQIKANGIRKIMVKLAAIAIGALSIMTAVNYINQPTAFMGDIPYFSALIMGVDVLTAIAILYYAISSKHYWIALLELAQVGVILHFEMEQGHFVKSYSPFLIDNFALVMIVIAGIIGSLIAVYSLGYMEEFHKEHPKVEDRRPFFFFVIFLFLSAMFGLVISNNLLYMYTCWEITSLSSFLLIGYTQTREAKHNSFKALWMNLLGGLAFAIAISLMGFKFFTLELAAFNVMEHTSKYADLILVLLVLCGFTKSAMMPFSGWLLGAMVAPTPTSALLHSSTMVKAGVFLIIKLCPLLGANDAGTMTMMVGGITFLFASCAAISQSDAKKVLAYSTISNLGLIVCCSGIGTYEAGWTAIMIVVFHAVAKSLCFLSVGTAEQQIGNRDIENFDGLFCSMPRLSLCMLVGICGMFLAPFGMLISKWAAMKSFVDAGHPLLVLILVYGSSTTLFYWCKWLGKICAYIPTNDINEKGIHFEQWLALKSLATMTIVVCLAFPLISEYVVSPYWATIYRRIEPVISRSNLLIMCVMVIILVVLPFRFKKGRKKRYVMTQLSGVNSGNSSSYYGAADREIPVTVRNWYMERWFGEKRMLLCGFTLCIACMLMAFSIICGGVFHA